MPHLSLSLLGPLQITLDGQPITRFKYHKAKALLAYLAVEADHPHPRESLAGLLWPDLPNDVALKNLSQSLANLRRALGEPAAGCAFLIVTSETIQFNLASDHELDVAVFGNLIAACEAHTHRSIESCSACAARLDQAAALYRDDFLAHFSLDASAPFEEWAQAKREALRPRALQVLEQLAAYHERHGDYKRAEVLARRQLALDPWHEPAHRQVMRLLALAGQRNAALAHYEDFRLRLAQELGAPPEPETTTLYEQLRTVGQAGLTASATPARRLKLHTRLEPFVGREKELAEIAALIEQPANRLIFLVGPGGIGKTRLAIEAAERHAAYFADGVYFVPLAALTTAEAVVAAMASALEIDAPSGSDPKHQLLSFLHEKELLLVLDSVEHLLADEPAAKALAGLVGDILDKAPCVTLLVTSRERLRMTGEILFVVPGLAVPPPDAVERAEEYDAVRLFMACASRANPAFRPTAVEAGEVAGLCRLLGGMPLGIEMAAAWVRVIGCTEIAAEIGRSLDFLQAPARDVPERHRSMAAAFDYTWQLLTDEERRAFRQLAVFRGGFEREAAEQVAGATLATLTALVDKSWVQHMAAGRYDLHELVRQYGLSKLEASGEADAARGRHARYFCALAEAAEPRLFTGAKRHWLDRLAGDLGNIRAALAWDQTDAGNPEEGLRMASALREFWEIRWLFREGMAWLDNGLAHELEMPAQVVARSLVSAGWLALRQGEVGTARGHFERGLAESRANGDTFCAAGCLSGLGKLALIHLDDSAEAMLSESLALYRQLELQAREAGDLARLGLLQSGEAVDLSTLGMLSRAHGDFESARAQFSESLALYQQLGDPAGIADATTGLGKVARSQGDYARAGVLYDQAKAVIEEMSLLVETIMEQGLLAHLQSDDEKATALLAKSLFVCSQVEYYGLVGYCLAWLGGVAAAQRQPERAARLLGAATTEFQQAGRRLGVAEQTEYDRAMAAAREQLDEVAFAAAWAEGQALSREQAVELALKT